jgi:signal transduction histidine kinase
LKFLQDQSSEPAAVGKNIQFLIALGIFSAFSVLLLLFASALERALGVWFYLCPLAELAFALALGFFTNQRFRALEAGNLEQQRKVLNSSKYAALGEVAAGMAHEINTPLGVVTLSASQLRDLNPDKPESWEFVKEIAGDIILAADKIARIVRGVKNFSRESTKGADFVFCDLPSVISEATSLCETSLRTAGVKLRPMNLPKSLDLQCNPSQISQVIVNLVNNARDAVENLSEKWIEVTLTSNSEMVEIRVTDSGKGIPLPARDKLFQPFYTTKEVGRGTGLGLSIVHGIVRSHKGEIFVDEKHPNTSFVVRLPRIQAP